MADLLNVQRVGTNYQKKVTSVATAEVSFETLTGNTAIAASDTVTLMQLPAGSIVTQMWMLNSTGATFANMPVFDVVVGTRELSSNNDVTSLASGNVVSLSPDQTASALATGGVIQMRFDAASSAAVDTYRFTILVEFLEPAVSRGDLLPN